MTKEQKNEIYDYCKQTIDNFEESLSIAYDRMDRMRCPLSMVDEYLANEIESACEEYCTDNNIEFDFDIEEII